MNISERKVYTKILGPEYDNEKLKLENITKKFIKMLKPHSNRDNNVTQITMVWACTDDGRKQNSQQSLEYVTQKILNQPKRVLRMNLETTRMTCRPRNRWQDQVRRRWKNSGWKNV